MITMNKHVGLGLSNYLLPHLCLFLSPSFLSNLVSVCMMSQRSLFYHLLSKVATMCMDMFSPALFSKLHLNWKTAAWNSVPSWSKYADIHMMSLFLRSASSFFSTLISMLKCIKTLSLTMYHQKTPDLARMSWNWPSVLVWFRRIGGLFTGLFLSIQSTKAKGDVLLFASGSSYLSKSMMTSIVSPNRSRTWAMSDRSALAHQ